MVFNVRSLNSLLALTRTNNSTFDQINDFVRQIKSCMISSSCLNNFVFLNCLSKYTVGKSKKNETREEKEDEREEIVNSVEGHTTGSANRRQMIRHGDF